jgi:hypothetical protein
MADAMKKHPEVDVLINFASLRSAYDSTIETMNYSQVDHWALGCWVGKWENLQNDVYSLSYLGQRIWESGEVSGLGESEVRSDPGQVRADRGCFAGLTQGSVPTVLPPPDPLCASQDWLEKQDQRHFPELEAWLKQ